MSVAAVIVTYNRIDMLKKTIDAVRSQSTPPHCIIVINNGSTDSTPQWLAQQKDIIAIEVFVYNFIYRFPYFIAFLIKLKNVVLHNKILFLFLLINIYEILNLSNFHFV